MLAQFDPAQIKVPSSGGLVDLNSPDLKIGDVIGSVLPFVFGLAGLALLIYMVTGGLQMMLSRGDPKAMQVAQGKITNGILGIIIMAAAFAITALIGRLLGIEVFGLIFNR